MPPDRSSAPLGWFGIVRLGLVQTALGAIVVLTTSTLNRIMVVELALPALLPGLLVGWHYVLQVLRPRWGYHSDRTGRRTPWIVGGMALLAAGGALAAVATALMGASLWLGGGLAAAAFTLIGIGVGCAGTSLLVLLAERTDERRRAPAATCVWLMMIAGFVVTTVAVGQVLDPYSPLRLVVIVGAASLLAFCLAAVAVQGLEGPGRPSAPQERDAPFAETLRQVWAEPAARRFTIFIFASMVAYSAQDLILEPFAGAVHGMTPGQSTKLGGLQHGGVFAGMILAPAIMALTRRRDAAALRGWMAWGCLGSAMALLAIALGGFAGDIVPLKPAVFALGLANGVFAVSAIAVMMSMASDGTGGRDGTRIGLWGAAQALAFGLGGLTGAAGADLARLLVGDARLAYAAVFALEAGVFVASAALAAWIRIERPEARPRQAMPQPAAQPVFAGE